jgi:hypothetical protein
MYYDTTCVPSQASNLLIVFIICAYNEVTYMS